MTGAGCGGVVAKLMRVADPATATALEVVAGGKLFQVVVDTEVTGKALLAKGKLAKRVTIVPLNKIDQGAPSPNRKSPPPRGLPDGDARLALSLVTYDDDVKNVMAYVFGKAFVCKDAATARAVAFDKDVLTNCVTVEGDLLNPNGLLTGGSRGGGGSVLAKLHALHDAECVLENATRVRGGDWRARGGQVPGRCGARAGDRRGPGGARAEAGAGEARRVGSGVPGVVGDGAGRACRAAAAEGADADAAKAESMTKRASLTVEIESFANEREQRLERAMEDVKAAKTALASARADVKAAETATRSRRRGAGARRRRNARPGGGGGGGGGDHIERGRYGHETRNRAQGVRIARP